MDCQFVGSKVEVIRPDTGEALSGKCVSKTKEGWVIQGEDEEVFGSTPVVAWLRTHEIESVVQGRMKPLNGPFMSLKQTGVLLRVSHGREDRYPVSDIQAVCLNLEESILLTLTDVGCRGFGFVCCSTPPSAHDVEFSVSGPSGQFQVTGTVVHLTPRTDGLFRGGVFLKLDHSAAKLKWLAVLAMCGQSAA